MHHSTGLDPTAAAAARHCLLARWAHALRVDHGGRLLAAVRRRSRAMTNADDRDPSACRQALAAHLAAIADTLVDAIDKAARLDLAVPPPVGGPVHGLRGSAARVIDPAATQPASVNTVGLLAYLYSLSEQQLLALLADLPWERLDALLERLAEPTRVRHGQPTGPTPPQGHSA